MKRLVIAALALVAVGVVASSALAGTAGRSSVIYDSTSPNGAPTNQVSYGPAAYSFGTIGDQIAFAPGTARSLNSATVTLSSWACQNGTWFDKNCNTTPGATFSQPITMKIYDASTYDPTNPAANTAIATSTQTFNVPYRPSASPKCGDGRWLTPSKDCKNGLADDVTFNFSHATLPGTVVYAISYPTSGEPSDSLNVAVTEAAPSVGTSSDQDLWINGAPKADFDDGWATAHRVTPAVQFKAGNAS